MSMIRSVGFRAEAQRIYWAVLQGTQHNPVLIDHNKASAPIAMDEPPALSWYSQRVRLIVDQHKPSIAAIRLAEPTAMGSGKEGAKRRSRLEGVLIQTLDDCGLDVTMGALATISSQMGSRAKKYTDADELRGLDISGFPVPAKEAILVAVARLPKG